MQIHLADGSVYLGDVTRESEAFLQVAGAAIIVPEQGEAGTAYRVQPLTGDPYSLAGPVVIAQDQVAMIGVVGADSPVARAYQDAMADAGEASPAPT